ncbi:N-acetylmuramidase domain-containing protein [Ralstonia pseudosolanacearum]|uniref:N-acetylmuramidase domain-containing protein n=1 Tax=Ralstonia pseudosolanacearum TaxID=1310165 RepID=UPI002E1B73A1
MRAVNEVESRGSGFLPDGRPVILFERHVMYRQLQGREEKRECARGSVSQHRQHSAWRLRWQGRGAFAARAG